MHKKFQPVILSLIKRGNKYLLTKRVPESKRQRPIWQFPGGGLEFEETIEECLKREIKEETNLDIKEERLIPKLFDEIRDNWHGILIPYLCQLKNDQQEIILNHESSEYGWFTFEEIKLMNMLPYDLDIVKTVEELNLHSTDHSL